MVVSQRRYSTGLRFLDQRIDGGIPAGSLITLAASAGSQSELLLKELTSGRDLLYVSTTTSTDAEVRERFEDDNSSDREITVTRATPASLLNDPEATVARTAPEGYLVIDPIGGLEQANRDAYLTFVNTVKQYVRDRDCIAFMHAIGPDVAPPPRRDLTLKRADQVWRLQTLFLSHEIKNRLLITKARGARALTEPIPLLLTDRVEIDTSRNI